jgi:hypothetical protein
MSFISSGYTFMGLRILGGSTNSSRIQVTDVARQMTVITTCRVVCSCSHVHYCLVSLMWMKNGSNDIAAQVPGVS